MDFTQKELDLIEKARKKAKNAKIIRIFLLIGMAIGLTCMLLGLLDSEKLAYGLVLAVFVAVAHPQLGAGPKYEDLVLLLHKKSANEAN